MLVICLTSQNFMSFDEVKVQIFQIDILVFIYVYNTTW